jgi:hypothetical protein
LQHAELAALETRGVFAVADAVAVGFDAVNIVTRRKY